MTDCLFCKMVAGDIQPDVVYEDEHALAFRDINPRAPVHILVIPKKHIQHLNDLQADDTHALGALLLVIQEVARKEGIAETGFRTVFNTGENAGQEVYHMHAHVLGGRGMSWPPG